MARSIGGTDIVCIGAAYAVSLQDLPVIRQSKKGSFWSRLKGALDARGLKVTQKQVADRFGVKQPTISGIWAKPGKGPEIALGAEIAAAYSLNVHWLYTGQGQAEVPPPDPMSQQLLRAWMRLRDTQYAGMLQAYADLLLQQKDAGGVGDTPMADPFLQRGTEPKSNSRIA